MSDNLFMDKTNQPDHTKMVIALGETGPLWNELKKDLEEKFGPLTDEWKYYSAKYGWTFKLLKKKRNLFFAMVGAEGLHMTFVFGDRAVEAVQKSDIPQAIKDDLSNARKYAEGRGVHFMVKTPEDAGMVKRLVEIKLSN